MMVLLFRRRGEREKAGAATRRWGASIERRNGRLEVNFAVHVTHSIAAQRKTQLRNDQNEEVTR